MSAEPGFFATLWGTPPTGLSRLSRYTVANGLVYAAAGLSFFFLPKGVIEAMWMTSLEGWDIGLVRSLGVILVILGWFYVIGGRTGAASFALATVADRMLVPFVLIPLWLFGLMPAVPVLLFSVLDPVLAAGGAVDLAYGERRRGSLLFVGGRQAAVAYVGLSQAQV